LHRYQGEDVSLGIWMDQASSSISSASSSSITFIQAKRMITNEGTQHCGRNKYMMIGHALSVEEIYHCHLQFGNRTFLENAWVDDPAEFEEQLTAKEESSWGDFGSKWTTGGGGGNKGSSSSVGYRGVASALYNDYHIQR
jgi:hypothetical protein